MHEQDERYDERHEQQGGEFDVAIIGMAGRFPGADDLDTFWTVLREGRETVTHFTDDYLRSLGVPEELLSNPAYVKSVGRLNDIQHFEAARLHADQSAVFPRGGDRAGDADHTAAESHDGRRECQAGLHRRRHRERRNRAGGSRQVPAVSAHAHG